MEGVGYSARRIAFTGIAVAKHQIFELGDLWFAEKRLLAASGRVTRCPEVDGPEVPFWEVVVGRPRGSGRITGYTEKALGVAIAAHIRTSSDDAPGHFTGARVQDNLTS
jgi:hypothetical protein